MYRDDSWNATVWTQEADGTKHHSVLEGHGSTSARTTETTKPDGSVHVESTTSSTSHGSTVTLVEHTVDGKVVHRGSTESDAQGHERSSTMTTFHDNGGATIVHRHQDDHGQMHTDRTTVDKHGNRVEMPVSDDDTVWLPSGDNDWDGPIDEFRQPWRVLAGEMLDETLDELGGYKGDIEGKVTLGTQVDEVRTALTRLVTEGIGWTDGLAETPILELALDRTTAATVNSGLGELTDAKAMMAFVTDLTRAAGGLASTDLLLPTMH
jgi:hypothetical protein